MQHICQHRLFSSDKLCVSVHSAIVDVELSAIALWLPIAHDSAVSAIVESLLVNRRLMHNSHQNKISNQHALNASTASEQK